MNVPLLYIHRYMRLTPLLGATFLISMSILRFFGSGPFWPTMLSFFHDECYQYWWSALLHIQNFVNQNDMVIICHTCKLCGKFSILNKQYGSNFNDKKSFSIQCFRHSWYLSLDTQLFLLAPGIVYLLFRFKTKALYALSIMVFGCVACTLAIHLKYNLTTMYVFFHLCLKKQRKCDLADLLRFFAGFPVENWKKHITHFTFDFPHG